MNENMLVIIKPDAARRHVTSEILKRLKSTGISVHEQKELTITPEQAAGLYRPHKDKAFYAGLVRYMTSGPVTVVRLSGGNAIARIRMLMGPTDPAQAPKGTIRGDFYDGNVFTDYGAMQNLIHGSDSPESAERELGIFFGKNS